MGVLPRLPPGGSGHWPKVMQLKSTGPGLAICHLQPPRP